jgi:hypothetical protein
LITIILAFRVVSSIAIYESHFKSLLKGGKNEQLIDKPQTHKDQFISFLCHFVGVDAYQLYFSQIGSPVLNKSHFGKPMKLFNYISSVPRLVMFAVCTYVLSRGYPGDMILVPMACILAQALLGLCYLLMNDRVREKIDAVFSCLRRPAAY